jgi:predicted metalloprotease with PDZ domain
MKSLNLVNSKKLLILVALLGVEIIVFNANLFAQNIEVKIKLMAPNRLSVKGSFINRGNSFKEWSFLQNYADVPNLGERIENIRFASDDYRIEHKKIGSGEFQATEPPLVWEYEVNLGKLAKITDAAHVSWLSENQGLLMLEDLLPQFKNKLSARITFDFPDDWKISTSENIINKNSFQVDEIGKAIFFIGKKWREKTAPIGKTSLNLALTGNWQFTDEEAFEMANAILLEYERVFGDIPIPKTQILLLPFPSENTDANRWRAETRGSTVTIISGVIPLKSVSIQRLHEQLRHELFHLWIPNALGLSGNYDWFYEGFGIYFALRTGIELNQIRFVDYLSTLSRGYDLSDWASSEKKYSLLETRWSGSNNNLYAKGLIVAFLCDMALLRESKGRRSLKDVFRALYRKHRKSNEIQEDGSVAILSILNSYPELRSIVQNYIMGAAKISWQNELGLAGIDFDGRKLSIKPKLNGRQKDLLDKLGYNQSLKLLEKKK